MFTPHLGNEGFHTTLYVDMQKCRRNQEDVYSPPWRNTTWGFPAGTSLGVPIVRIIVYWGPSTWKITKAFNLKSVDIADGSRQHGIVECHSMQYRMMF